MATFVGRRRPQLVALLAASLLCSGAEASIPLLLSPLLSADPDVLALCMLGAAIALSIVANVWRHVLSQRIKAAIALDVRTRLADRVALRSREVAATLSPSAIATVASTDVDRFANFPVLAVRFVASTAALVFVATYLMLISPWVGLVVLLGVPALMRLTSMLASPLEDRQEAHRDSLDAVATRSADLGEGLRTILGLRAARHFRESFRQASARTRDAGVAAARLEAMLLVVGQLVPGLLTLTLVAFGVGLVRSHLLAPVDLVVFYAAAAYLAMPLQAFGNLLTGRGRSKASTNRIEQALDDEAESTGDDQMRDPGVPTPDRSIAGDLVDRGTGTTVPAQGLAVTKPEAASGDEIARRLTGIDPTSDVTVGGHPLAGVPLDDRSSAIRALFASPYLFAGSLRELLDPHGVAADDEIWAALRTAAADDIVERLAEGLDEPVGSNAR
ncbi:ABC transporter transmembrane domain-containing protein, partial [Staphylococcus capitis]|uniref:ABC transporter transmembrane domain-containing protein n=1 Tax=Staphylococcus capitis TaxID=29388 RepID=UPI003CFE2018